MAGPEAEFDWRSNARKGAGVVNTGKRLAGLMMMIFGQSFLLCIFGLWAILELSASWQYFMGIGFATLLMSGGGLVFFFGGKK